MSKPKMAMAIVGLTVFNADMVALIAAMWGVL